MSAEGEREERSDEGEETPEPENRGTGEREDHRAAPPGHEIPEVEAEWKEEMPADREGKEDDSPEKKEDLPDQA